MYPLVWNSENGIILRYSGEGEVLPSLRPVFHEELDLFGFNEFWEYPKSEAPLLWRVNRTYYYNGEAIGRIVGGGFFKKPELEVYKRVKLEPIDLDRLRKENKEIMNLKKLQILYTKLRKLRVYRELTSSVQYTDLESLKKIKLRLFKN
ncbi:MAG: hypothetical protein QXM61_06805 [Archaeoglobaceae archaeon]